MNIDAAITLLSTILTNANILDNTGKTVYILTDPYAKLTEYMPLILIEEASDSGDLIAGPNGIVRDFLHRLDITCAVAANKEESIQDYKARAVDIGKQVVEAINLNNRSHNYQITPRKFNPGELIIDSLKCSGVLIKIDVLTKFID